MDELPIPKGRATGIWKSDPKRMTYTRKDAIRAGRPMRFVCKGKVYTTAKA